MDNQYIYLMLEELENDYGEYETVPVFVSTNVNDFLVALTTAPRCVDMTLLIVDNGRININYDYRLYVHYHHHSYKSQCNILSGLINEIFACKSIHIDIRDTIISYINDYINKTDFEKMDRLYMETLDNERQKNRLQLMYDIAEEFNYDVIKKEE